jgi:hypothetical protein
MGDYRLVQAGHVPFNAILCQNEDNARRRLLAIPELAAMIEATGWCAPLLVEPAQRDSDGSMRYHLRAGFRRYAALLVIRERTSGVWNEVPVQLLGDRQVDGKFVHIAENLCRQEISVYDLVEYYHSLRKDGVTHEEIARALGLHVQRVRDLCALRTKLDNEIWTALGRGLTVPIVHLTEWAKHPPEEQIRRYRDWLAITSEPVFQPAKPKLPGFVGMRRTLALLERWRQDGHESIPLECVEYLIGKRRTLPHGYASTAAIQDSEDSGT